MTYDSYPANVTCNNTDVSVFGVGLQYHISSKMLSVLRTWNVLMDENKPNWLYSNFEQFLRIPEGFGDCIERYMCHFHDIIWSVMATYTLGSRLNWNGFWDQWRTRGVWGGFKLPPPRNSEVLTKSNRIAN